MQTLIHWFLVFLAIPEIGLAALFVVSFISATLIPLGSEPALFAYVKLRPDMWWPAILVASAGNTLGGALDWWMGYAARAAALRFKRTRRQARRGRLANPADPAWSASADVAALIQAEAPTPAPTQTQAAAPRAKSSAATAPSAPALARHAGRVRRLGPAVLVLGWLPVVGDPLCALAGWLRLPFLACVGYMALGKFLRYVILMVVLRWVPDPVWAGMWAPVKALLGL